MLANRESKVVLFSDNCYLCDAGAMWNPAIDLFVANSHLVQMLISAHFSCAPVGQEFTKSSAIAKI